MSDGGKPKRKKNRLPRLVLLLVVFVATAFLVTLIVFGGRAGCSPFSGLIRQREPVFTVNEFNFNIGRDRVFSHSGGFVAAAGSLGIQVMGSDGRESLRDSFRMTVPAITESGGRFLAFDVGGSALRIFNSSQVLSSIETEGDIVSASINQSGWFCIVTQEHGGARGTVTVYNNNGSSVYEVDMWSGFVLSASLSPDNKTLAILNLTDVGSRISFYQGIDEDKDEADYLFSLPGELIIDMKYLSNTEVLAISTDSLLLIDGSGRSSELYAFPDKRLGGYVFNDEFAALHLYDYGIGYSGRIVTILFDGTVLGELGVVREILSISSGSNYLTVLRSDGLSFYDKELEESPITEENISAANRVLALGNNAALATSDHSAIIVRRLSDN